jgi:hypothetical protein
MMRAPSRAAIRAAELRYEQAAGETVNGLHRARTALRETLARPSTLALVAGLAAVSGFFLARRGQPQVQRSGRRRVEKDPAPTLVGLVTAFVVRQALARLPAILEQVWTARRQAVAAHRPPPSPPRRAVHSQGRVLH